ncbi:MAG TPA: IS110 family transposase [Candidatus Sulfotelmatobacter sp.]|nr:IS110 family transposase [Candidatus Sulfotelmatobacter sp.]
MPYTVAGIDIHKKVLMVVVAIAGEEAVDPAGEAIEFECRRFGTGAAERNHLVGWLRERNVTEVVMESTAQYWKPVWLDLEPHFAKLHLAQAHSNRAPKGRKSDFRDGKRLTRRLLADELILSFVPDAEQRLWRTVTRGKHQLIRERVRLQSQLEALLEEARIKLSSVISDLLGVSGRRILQAMADGETVPERLAELGDDRLQCSKEELVDALNGSLEPIHRQLLRLYMERLHLLDQQIDKLDLMTAAALKQHQDAVIRVAEIPGFGVDSAQQLIAEMGVDAGAFQSAGNFTSWAGLCPGSEESAEQNHSSRSAKGNRFVRRILTQAAQAAVKKKGSYFQTLFRRFLPRLHYNGAIWAIAHRLGRLVWKILHDGVSYIEQGQETNPAAKKRRAQKMVQALRKLGYAVALTPIPDPSRG